MRRRTTAYQVSFFRVRSREWKLIKVIRLRPQVVGKAQCHAALAANMEIVREVIAKRIIEMATKGERDPERLYNSALKGIQKSVPLSDKPY